MFIELYMKILLINTLSKVAYWELSEGGDEREKFVENFEMNWEFPGNSGV